MIAEWQTFFATMIGTIGALLGLLFVSVSISVQKIVTSKGLPRAAAQPLIVLLGTLIASIFFLVPGQGLFALGAEVLGTGVLAGAAGLANDYGTYRNASRKEAVRNITNAVFNELSFLLIAIAGIVLMTGRAWGAVIMVPATVVAFIQASTIAWAFLVAIHLEHGRFGGRASVFEGDRGELDPPGGRAEDRS